MTETQTPIRLVIFDMDGVLDHYNIEARLEKLSAATGKSPESIHAAIWKSGLEDQSDAGKISAAEYLRESAARVGAPISLSDWIAARRAAMTPNRGVLSLAAEIRKKAAIAVLTNNGFIVKETFGETFPELIPLFGDRLHVAAEFGTRKPDPEVYRRLAARHGFDPASAMMIDDKLENVAGAEAAGLTGHLYGTTGALAGHLRNLGLV